MTDVAASSTFAPSRSLPLRVLSDDRLARLTAAGSERAFAVLYERHHQALYRYCRTVVRHDEDARDVLQTTMMRALAALGRGVPDAPIRPWLFRIAHNEAVSVLRRRRPTIDLEQAPELEARGLEARVEERRRLTALVADLNALPERQRGALVMRELSGLSHEEIAAALDISVSAVKQAIFDARTGLAEFAKGRAMQCAEVERIVSERDGRMLRGRPLRAHLRDCDSCRALRDGIGARRADLAAIAPPLPAAAAMGLLAGILGGGGSHGAGGGLASAVAAKVASAAVGTKALAGAAVVATVAVGTTQVLPRVDPPTPRAAAPATTAAAGAAAAAPRAALPASTSAAAPAGADRAVIAATAHRATTTSTGSRRHAPARTSSHPSTTAGSASTHGHGPAATSNGAARRGQAAARHPATPASARRRRGAAGTRAPSRARRRAKPTAPAHARKPRPSTPASARARKRRPSTPARPARRPSPGPARPATPAKPPRITPAAGAAPPPATPAVPSPAAPAATPPAAAPSAASAAHRPASSGG